MKNLTSKHQNISLFSLRQPCSLAAVFIAVGFLFAATSSLQCFAKQKQDPIKKTGAQASSDVTESGKLVSVLESVEDATDRYQEISKQKRIRGKDIDAANDLLENLLMKNFVGQKNLSFLNSSEGEFGGLSLSAFQREELTGKKVKRAIERGTKFLFSRQRRGRWGEFGGYRSGVTSLVLLALINAGVPPDDDRIIDTIDELATEDNEKTYVVALITMVLANSNPEKYRRKIEENVRWLEEGQFPSGGWGYGGRGNSIDASNSQFAVLALHEAQKVGIDVDIEVWERARKYWESVYYKQTGGFRYTSRSGVSGSMTCAGIASIVIIDENINLGSKKVKNGEVRCCGDSESNHMIEKSIQWLARHFLVGNNPGALHNHRFFVYYYRYSVERAGRLTGRRFFGKRDWYREIASYLTRRRIQRLNGAWIGSGAAENEDIATSMALLFLAKGLRPILASKYQYNANRSWDRHPRGIHYLTRFTERVWKTKLNWQSIDGRRATLNDLLETPVLMISGDGPMNLSKKQKDTLKKYIDNGGFVFFEANRHPDCPKAAAFNKEVRSLMAEWFPDSKLKVLSPEHPVWTAQFKVKPDQKFPLLGIESCCRTSVIYCASPISAYWQLKTPGSKNLPDPAKGDVDYSAKLGVNILAFATGNVLKDRLDRPKVEDDSEVSVLGRQMVMGKLAHGAGYNDAPAALGNLVRRSNIEKGLQFHNQTKLVAANSEDLEDYPVLFVHGRGKIEFTAEQRKALKAHLDRGGFIFGDAICGNEKFYQSFKQEMLRIVEGAKWEKLGEEHPIFSTKYNGYNIEEVQRRGPKDLGKFVKAKPELDALKIGDRYQVVFSQYDLSCALENGTSNSCIGYSQDDAVRIGINILLYAMHP